MLASMAQKRSPAVLAAVDVVQSAIRRLSEEERAEVLEIISLGAAKLDERERIELALAEANQNHGEAARLLGVARMTLRRRMRELGFVAGKPGRRPAALRDLTSPSPLSKKAREKIAQQIKEREQRK